MTDEPDGVAEEAVAFTDDYALTDEELTAIPPELLTGTDEEEAALDEQTERDVAAGFWATSESVRVWINKLGTTEETEWPKWGD